MRLIVSLLILAFISARAQGGPLVLENRFLRLSFDPKTGAWNSLVDRATGDELVAGPAMPALLPSLAQASVDTGAVARAAADGRALSLDGDWLYTPEPQKQDAGAAFVAGRFGGAKWERTPVPSRRGTGDDRLHNRVGEFWYRREFALPAGFAADGLVLLIGAVDDFDVTYLNGRRIGSTGAETPHHWETPRAYRIPKGLLHSGEPNVLLVHVTNGAYDGGIAGPVALAPESAIPRPAAVPIVGTRSYTRSGSNRLEMTARQGDWEYRLEYALRNDRPLVSRQLTVRNAGAAPQTLSATTLALPPLAVGATQAIIFPGTLPVGDIPADSVDEGQALSPRSMDPLALLWDAAKGRGAGTWYACDEEYSPVAAQRAGAGLVLRHTQQIVAPLKPGESVQLGTQYFWLSRGSRDQALRGVQEVYREVGLKPPARALTGLREKVIYCGHPGGTPEMGYRGYGGVGGGFRAFQAYLPTLKKLGVDLLWFLPIWEHGDGTRWNLYSPFDHFRVSPLYGTPADLKALSAAAKARGVRLMFDLVPHGPPDFTPLAKEHPEWAARGPDGKVVYAWSQLAFDNALPGWQDYMRRAAALDGREYDAVGARVDCGAGGPLNYSPTSGHRPSESGLCGGLGMNKAVRDGFLESQRQVVLLPEEYTGANAFYRVADLTYDAQLFFLMVDLEARKASPEEWATSFQRFLHDQSLTLPPGALKMRWISNHDTVSWTFQAKRPEVVYGLDGMRALLALTVLVDGVPMIYQGDEDPAVYGGKGPSNVEFISRLMEARRANPALRRGTADYDAVHSTGGVFACLRKDADRQTLVLISFSPTAIQTRLSGAPTGTWHDALSGEDVPLGGPVPMAPHQVRILEPK